MVIREFQDSHEETIILMKNEFGKRVINDSDIDYTSLQVFNRINYIYRLIEIAMDYRSELISDTLLRSKPEIRNKIADELIKILKDSLKDCSGLFYSNPRHCADEYLKKRCNTVFKKYGIESDFLKDKDMFLKPNIVNIKIEEEYDENCIFHPRFKTAKMFLEEMFEYYNIEVNNIYSDWTGLIYKHNFKNFTFSNDDWGRLHYYSKKNVGIEFLSLNVYNIDWSDVYLSNWFDSFNKLRNPKPFYEIYNGYITKYFTKSEYVVTTFEEFRPCYEEIMKIKEDFIKKIEICDNLYEYYESLNIKENIGNFNKQIKTLKDAREKYKKKIISSTIKKIEIENDFLK